MILTNDGQSPSEEAVRHATRPFFTTHHDKGHRGLGLASSLAILRDQNGVIELDKRHDGIPGARCIITLPLCEPQTKSIVTQRQPDSGKILIVDDDPMITELLSEFLQDDGINVVVVATSEEAQQAIVDHPICAVIADYHLDRTSGIEVLKALIEHQPGLRGHVAVFTGANDATTLEKIAEDTGYKVLAKPFRLEQVQRLVRDILA